MLQYTKCADPAESEARKERLRQAEEKVQLERSAISMARKYTGGNIERRAEDSMALSTERIPVMQRLGTAEILPASSKEKGLTSHSQDKTSGSQERISVALRLGPSPPPAHGHQDGREDEQPPFTGERLPAVQRLGPLLDSPSHVPTTSATKVSKRKPGRPPGKSKAQDKTGAEAGPSTRKRRVSQVKPSPVRRKAPSPRITKQSKATGGTSRARQQTTSVSNSDDRPICNMIPPTAKKRMDFRIPSTPVP